MSDLTWEEVREKLFTPEERAESDRRVAEIGKQLEGKPVQYFKICRVRCKRCSDVLEYRNKTKQDNPARLLRCGCGRVALDPSAALYRILGEPEDYEDLSEAWED